MITPQNSVAPATPNAVLVPSINLTTRIVNGKLRTGAGTYQPVAAGNVRDGVPVGVSPTVGSCYVPAAADVRFGVNVSAVLGTLVGPTNADVRFNTAYDINDSGVPDVGTCHVPAAGSVALGVPVDHTVGEAVLTAEDVAASVTILNVATQEVQVVG